MIGIFEDRTLRRSRKRIADIVAHRCAERTQALLFRSSADLEALRALTEAEREAFEAHARRWLGEAG